MSKTVHVMKCKKCGARCGRIALPEAMPAQEVARRTTPGACNVCAVHFVNVPVTVDAIVGETMSKLQKRTDAERTKRQVALKEKWGGRGMREILQGLRPTVKPSQPDLPAPAAPVAPAKPKKKEK